jgi:hypothetical protein
MVDPENSPTVKAALIVGCCLLIGLTAAGYFIGRGTARFKSDVRTVTVKGLVEKEVKADEAVWTLSLKRASDDLRDVHARISADRDAVLAFLHNQGFDDEEIARQPTRTVDKPANLAKAKTPSAFAIWSAAPSSCARRSSRWCKSRWAPPKSY